MKIELTTREWKLYNLLLTNPNKWFTQKEICDEIKEYNYNPNPKATNDHCSMIGSDKRKINACAEIDHIIVMKDYQFKIASESEYLEERNSHIARLKSQVKQIQDMDLKFDRNGQGKLLNSILEELKPQNQQFHETFIK